MYDEIRNPGPQPQDEKTGDEDDNYYEVAESTFTNTYDCGATEIYSDLTEQRTHTCTPEVSLFRGVICFGHIWVEICHGVNSPCNFRQ